MDKVIELKKLLKRKAIIFEPLKGKSRGDNFASYFGNVILGLKNEEWPISEGKAMTPLAQINLKNIEYLPDSLKGIELLTIFINEEDLPYDEENGDKWELRAYENIDELVPLYKPLVKSCIKSFEMVSKVIENDYPCWEDFVNFAHVNKIEIDDEIEEKYFESFETLEGFKIGGWPLLVQSEVFLDSIDVEYVLQIDSNEKGNWMWGDSGVGYFGKKEKEKNKNSWKIEWQCY